MGTTTQRTASADKFDRVWASLSSADRIVLLGHDRPELTVAEKVRLAAVARNLRQAPRILARRPRTTT